jgi:hypothetical protein
VLLRIGQQSRGVDEDGFFQTSPALEPFGIIGGVLLVATVYGDEKR